MTDDKGAGEGPYRIDIPDEYKGESDYVSPRLLGPGLGRWGAAELEENSSLADVANTIYAEGRKSAEKDFKELLKTTEYVVDRIGDSGPFGQMHALEKFRAWKVARGIE